MVGKVLRRYQIQDALLDAIAALSWSSGNQFPYFTSATAASLGTVTADALLLLADSDVPRLGTSNNWTGSEDNHTGQIQIGTFDASGATLGLIFRAVAPGMILSSMQGSSTARHAGWYNLNGLVGTITTAGSATAYNTSSDRRLKDITGDLDRSTALGRIMAVKLRTYTWKADGVDGYGVIADELAEVIPHAVTGDVDAIEEEWVVDGEERYLTTTKESLALDQLSDAEDAHKLSEAISPQGVDYSKVMPDALGAIQAQQQIIEAQGRQIEAQAAQIAELQKQVAALSTPRTLSK